MKKNLLFVMLLAFIFSFEGMSQCGLVSLIGEFNDWAGDHYMDRDPMDVNSFSTILVLTDSDDTSDPPDGIVELKFRENADWAVNWGDTTFPTGIGLVGGGNIPVPVGSYYVMFNCETGEYSFTQTCGTISMIGEFNGWADDHFMMRDPMDMDMWTTTVTFTEDDDVDPIDGFVSMKFRENMDWAVNWGDTAFPVGIGVQDGGNIPVPLGSYLISFNCSTGEYEFTETCGEIGLIGEFNGWADDLWMTRDMADPDSWSLLISLSEEDDVDPVDGIVNLKFRQNSDWGVNWGSADFPSGVGVQDGDNIPVPLDGTGLTSDYLVTFNCATGEYNFQSTCGDISMIGAFIDWNGDVPMNRDAMDPDMWTLSRSWYADSEVKFRENADWTVNWGSASWPSGTGEDNGPNIPLVMGKYDVTFNCATFEYGFVENPDICGEIGMIGDFNEWGGGGIPSDVYLERDPMYPTLFSLTYNFTSTTNLLFRYDADQTVTNWLGGSFPMGQAIPWDQNVANYLQVTGGIYKITYNCAANTFSFEQLGSSIIASKVFAMNVDGILNETDWDISQPVGKVVEGTVTEDLNTVFFGATYNDEYLYIGMDILDGILMPNEEGHLFIDGDKSGGEYDEHDAHIKFSGAGVEVIQGPAGLTPMLGFVPSAVGYSAEVGIAWADLGLDPPVEGEGIRIDVIVGDDDNGAAVDYYLAWNGSMANLESTSGFGDMVFGTLSCGYISVYNETTGDVGLRTPTDLPTTYVGTYELDADYNMVFRKDMQGTVSWGAADFPTGVAELDGAEIPATTGRYRVTFDCLSGEFEFEAEPTSDGVAYADFTETPVEIDGNLAEYSLDYGSDIMATTTGPENNNTVTWGALWDMQSFYIGVQVVDAIVEGSGNPWENDAIEFYIDGNHDSDGGFDADFDTQLIMDAFNNGQFPDTLWVKADGVAITDYDAYWMATGDGYICELRIGWGNLGFYPGKNRSIGWSLANNDSDNGLGRDYQTTWFGNENNWNDTEVLGDLQLAGGPYFGIHDVVYYNAQFVLYPNPSNGTTYLRTNGDIFDGQVNIIVTDLSGRTVVSQTERLFGSNDVTTLNTNDLQSGLYLINIMGADGKKAVKKLIIQ